MKNQITKVLSSFLLSGIIIGSPVTSTLANVETKPAVISNVKLSPEEQSRADKLAKNMITMQAISIAIGEQKRAELITATKNNQNISVEITSKELNEINKILKNEGVALLPTSTKSINVTETSYVLDTGNGNNIQVFSARSAGDTAWQITKCAGYIALAIVPASKAYKAVKALGGIRQTATLLVGAGNRSDFIKIGGELAAEIVGVDGVLANCTF